MDIAVRKSTRNGLKNKANDDVIRQAHLKQEMMSDEQMGPIQVAIMLKQQYRITPPDPGGGCYGHEFNDRDVMNTLNVNQNFEPSPDDILAWIDEYYEAFTIKLEQNLDFDEDEMHALQSEINEACETIKRFQLLFPQPALNKLLFDLKDLHHDLKGIPIDLFLENIQLDRYSGAREGLVEAPVLECTSCKRLLEDDFAQCPCNTAQKFCVSCCPFQEPEDSPCAQNVAKEMQTELCADETYEDSINNHIVNTNKDKGLAGTKEDSQRVVDGNSEDEMPDAKTNWWKEIMLLMLILKDIRKILAKMMQKPMKTTELFLLVPRSLL